MRQGQLLFALLFVVNFCFAEVTSISASICEKRGGWVKTTRSESQAKICVEGLYDQVAVVNAVSGRECERGLGYIYTVSGAEMRGQICLEGLYSNLELSDVTRAECIAGGGYIHEIRAKNILICVAGTYSEKLIRD